MDFHKMIQQKDRKGNQCYMVQNWAFSSLDQMQILHHPLIKNQNILISSKKYRRCTKQNKHSSLILTLKQLSMRNRKSSNLSHELQALVKDEHSNSELE